MVYVLSKSGKPIMPTRRYGKVRHLLKDGKAKVVRTVPFFQIQLLYDSKEYTQDVTLKVDSGYTYIGLSAVTSKDEVLSAEAELISDMKERFDAKRNFRRIRRSRLRYRKPRFDNRKRPEGWLAPSIQHKYESHIRLINTVKKLLPVTRTIIEVAAFDTQRLKNPSIQGTEYQKGPKTGFFNAREYVFYRDGYKCQCPTCRNKSKNPILRVHHFKYWKGATTDNPDELITVCNLCHTPENHEKGQMLWGWEPKVSKTLKEAAFMTAVRWKMVDTLHCDYSYGYITKSNRIDLKLPKTHANDAFCIEGTNNQRRCETIYLKQVRKNIRTIENFYDAKYIDSRTGKPASGKALYSGRFSRNRNIAGENLHKYRKQKVSKGHRSIRTKRYKLNPYDTVIYNNKKYLVAGIQNKGAYVKLKGLKKVPKVQDVKLLYYAKGFVKVEKAS